MAQERKRITARQQARSSGGRTGQSTGRSRTASRSGSLDRNSASSTGRTRSASKSSGSRSRSRTGSQKPASSGKVRSNPSRTGNVGRSQTGSQKKASRNGRGNSKSRKAPAKGRQVSLRDGIGSAASAAIERIRSSRAATAVVVVVAVLLVIGLWDGLSNWGKAYDNVKINGTSVAGMTEQEIHSLLEGTYGERVASTSITVNAKDADAAREVSDASDSDDERDMLAQLVQAEYSDSTTEWSANAESLHATLPYDEAIKQAMEAGRGAGPFGRIALIASGVNVPFEVDVDERSVESLAANIDKAVGVMRVDATAIVEGDEARVLPGHDGEMVDRAWLTEHLKEALMSDQSEVSFVAQVEPAPSRTTAEQAQEACDAINRAMNLSATFRYRTSDWTADGNDFSSWTKVDVVEKDGGYALKIGIDESKATHDLIKGLGATVDSGDVTVTFDVDGDVVTVHTNGSGTIPEIAPALQKLEEGLYGEGGLAWNTSTASSLTIDVSETDAPESLTFDEAHGLGLITVIGEYTTDFSNDEGSENRNHNIRLVSDLLNNTVATANGGQWSFNEHSGDTNQDPPFASAGSIVNGEYVDSIGGGICQVATTVFNAVYEAGLNVVKRLNHTLFISSYPEGRDASVDYPLRDLIWENQLDSDVLVKMSYTDTSVTAQLYSVYTGYHVETEPGAWEDGEPYRTEFEVDQELGEGQAYQKQYGENGSRYSVTRIVLDKNNKEISREVFASTYEPKNEVFVVGPGTDTSRFGSTSSGSSSSGGGYSYDSAGQASSLYDNAALGEDYSYLE